jgi:hypothetical protein
MPISWNEIRHMAIRFASEWAGETREEAEVTSFWEAFRSGAIQFFLKEFPPIGLGEPGQRLSLGRAIHAGMHQH